MLTPALHLLSIPVGPRFITVALARVIIRHRSFSQDIYAITEAYVLRLKLQPHAGKGDYYYPGLLPDALHLYESFTL